MTPRPRAVAGTAFARVAGTAFARVARTASARVARTLAAAAPRLAAAGLLVLLPGCPGGDEPDKPDQVGSASPQVSNAGEDVLARAGSEEERQALREVRAEEDERGRRAVAERDAEIERLRRENAELEKRLGEDR